MSSKHTRTSAMHRWIGAASIAAGLACGSALAASFVDPPVFASQNGVLDIMMIAKAKPIPTISFTPPHSQRSINPTGWVYEVCKRPPSGLTCPSGSGTVSPYGGVRLALQPGDTLKVRFVNRLPKVDPSKLNHVTDPGEANLFRNPTNLHTHGLLTPARAATVGDPTFGDFVFVTIFNSANGVPVPQTTHQHGPIVMDTVDYKIPIPNNHPSGLLWFHPHVHGIALNQVVQGLSGLITIGSVGDNVTGDCGQRAVSRRQRPAHAAQGNPGPGGRHGRFRQRSATGRQRRGAEPGGSGLLRANSPRPHEMRQGSCPGQNNSAGRQQLHRREMVLHRQRPAIPHHPDHGARRRNLADRHRRRQPQLRSATGQRRQRTSR